MQGARWTESVTEPDRAVAPRLAEHARGMTCLTQRRRRGEDEDDCRWSMGQWTRE